MSWDETLIVDEADDVAVSGEVAPSLTLSSKLYVSPVVSVLPRMLQVTVFPAIWPEPLVEVHGVIALYAPLLIETSQL